MKTCVQDIINFIAASKVPEGTVDRLEYGTGDMIVNGVAVTFVATQEVVRVAKELGLNLIISHEGIFYSHWDKREMLKSDEIYQTKCRSIEESKVAVYRLHDHIHRDVPDGITAGLLYALDWKKYEVKDLQVGSVLQLPSDTLENLILHIKKHLGIEHVRFSGNLNMQCSRVGVLVGYRGGIETSISLAGKENLDLLVYGEGPEWETPEYIRDALQQGKNKALVVLGHMESEAPGMAYLAQQLKERFPGVPVRFISQDPVLKIF
jgi:putative NIF3 family GTP cyclohydrolase 1 type 2